MSREHYRIEDVLKKYKNEHARFQVNDSFLQSLIPDLSNVRSGYERQFLLDWNACIESTHGIPRGILLSWLGNFLSGEMPYGDIRGKKFPPVELISDRYYDLNKDEQLEAFSQYIQFQLRQKRG